MMQSLQFIQTTPEKLVELINEGIKNQLQDLKKDLQGESAKDELMSREQTAALLQVHETTLWHWTNKGKIKAYSIAGKRYYKRSEIMNSLTLLKK